MIDDTPFDIGVQQQALQALAEFNAPFGRPTGVSWPVNFKFYPNSRFILSELQFDSTVSYAGNRYSATFRVVVRSLSNNV
jgi:hypothetical protein